MEEMDDLYATVFPKKEKEKVMVPEQRRWEYEWFIIIEVPDNHSRDKKRLFTVHDKEFSMKKSRIKWHPDLKCYTFVAAAKIAWNVKALSDIVGFINTLEADVE